LLTAGLSHVLSEKGLVISKKSRQILERLAHVSYEKYVELKNHKLFLPYLENKSTLKYYGMSNIGSRPAKRGNTGKLTLKDLRAISFVGSWSQLRQNVPGYFGIGTALKTLADDTGLDTLQKLYAEVPVFKALIMSIRNMIWLGYCPLLKANLLVQLWPH